jgi:hypothetical protein
MDILRKDGKFSKKHGLAVYKRVNNDTEHRRYIRLKNGKLVPYSRFLWDLTYPLNKLKNDEEIHHQDFNALNDEVDNLMKVTPLQHKKLHELQKLGGNIIAFNLGSALRQAIESRKIPNHSSYINWDEANVNVWPGHSITNVG